MYAKRRLPMHWMVLCASVMVALLISACAAPAAPAAPAAQTGAQATGECTSVKYMVAAGSPFSVAVVKRIPEFEEQTGIKVEVIELPYEQTLSKSILEAKNASGAYDLIQINRPSLAALAEPGLLLPLEEYISKDLVDDLFPVHRNYATFDGKLYAVPHSNDLRALYYRTDLFTEAGIEKAPETWDEMVAAAEKLNAPDKGVNGLLLAGSPKGPGVWVLSDFIYQAGGSILDDQGKVALDSPEAKKGLQFMTDLVNKYKVAPSGTADYMWGDTRNNFAQGRGAMVIEFNDIIPLLDGADSAVKGKYDLALLPGDARGGTNNAGWLLGIPVGAKNPACAGKLIDWIMSPEIQAHMSRESGTLSGRASVIDKLIAEGADDLPTGDVNGKARWEFYKKVIDTTYELPRTSVEPQIEDAMAQAVTAALSGAQAPDAALDEAAAKVREILGQ
jgi:multiple sugar transport system substrate-binding protein